MRYASTKEMSRHLFMVSFVYVLILRMRKTTLRMSLGVWRIFFIVFPMSKILNWVAGASRFIKNSESFLLFAIESSLDNIKRATTWDNLITKLKSKDFAIDRTIFGLIYTNLTFMSCCWGFTCLKVIVGVFRTTMNTLMCV